MFKNRLTVIIVLAAFVVLISIGCGGSQETPETADDVTEDDIYDSIVGDVDESELEIEDDEPEEDAYTGPTQLTVNLKVINEKNPEGSFKLLDASGRAVLENGKLGEPMEVLQGEYEIEFKSPLVFGEPVFSVKNVDVTGEKMEISEVFPAGQITLHTYKKRPNEKCKSVPFSVKFETGDKELPGKGKTCKPIVLEIGSYELLLDVSKKVVQPVKIQVTKEQVSTASVQLEK